MTIRTFQAVIDVTSPTSATTTIVANMDPNVHLLPSWLLEFAMKNIAGVVLVKMQGAARRVAENPSTSPHARQMRQDCEFYEKWLLPKCQKLCESRGWQMTPVCYFDGLLPKGQQHPQEASPSQQPFMRANESQLSTGSIDGDAATMILSANSSEANQEGDTVSDLSKDSSTMRRMLQNNIVAKFIRRQEQKSKRRKASKRADMMQRSRERLVARNISDEDQLRFAALQDAKASRSNKLSRSLNSHSTKMRAIVMVTLIAWLLIALYPELLLFRLNRTLPWRDYFSNDTEAIISILLCAVPHFSLCDVSLVYAFDGLELGARAGEKVRSFYNDTVRYCMMLLSFGIAAFSVSMAAAKAGLHSLVENFGARSSLGMFLQSKVLTNEERAPWTSEAYGTARCLFLYTSSFLVSLVVVFFAWLSVMQRKESAATAATATTGDNNHDREKVHKVVGTISGNRPLTPTSSVSTSLASISD